MSKHRQILMALTNLECAFMDVWRTWESLDTETQEELGIMAPDYPFELSFDEQSCQVGAWVETMHKLAKK